jgi:hypothetical protein
MTSLPLAAPSAQLTRRPGIVVAVRVGIAGGLICLIMPPLFVLATTAENFDKIFGEFGVRSSPLQAILLGFGRMLGTPAGVVAALLLVPLVCYLLALVAIPAGTRDSAEPSTSAGRRPSWGRIVSVVGGTALVSLVLYMGYTMLMLGTMTTVVGKLNTPAPAPAVQPSR